MRYINGWSIFEYEGGYRGQKNLGKDKYGRRKRKTFRGKTLQEVKNKINDYEFAVATGQYMEPCNSLLVDFLKEYHGVCAGCDMWASSYMYPVKKAKWAETTAELYKMYIDVHIAPYFKQMKLIDVLPIELDKFYNYCLTHERKNEKTNKTFKMGVNTVVKLNRFLKSAFNYAKANGLIKENPCNRVILSPGKDYDPNVYDEEKFAELLKTVTGTDDEIPIILAAGCGLRRGEIFGLRWKDIDFKENTITIEITNVRFNKYKEKDPKSKNSKRTFVAPAYVIERLKLYRARCGKHNPDDKVISAWKPNAYSQRFKKLLLKYGLPLTRLHDLRHYNAVLMMDKVPDKVAAKRLGHSVDVLRKIYQHVRKDFDANAAEKINAIFESKNSHQASGNA